jgi:hypothetical protein
VRILRLSPLKKILRMDIVRWLRGYFEIGSSQKATENRRTAFKYLTVFRSHY